MNKLSGLPPDIMLTDKMCQVTISASSKTYVTLHFYGLDEAVLGELWLVAVCGQQASNASLYSWEESQNTSHPAPVWRKR